MTVMWLPFVRFMRGVDMLRWLLFAAVLLLSACSLIKPASTDVSQVFDALTSDDLVLAKSAVQTALERSLRGQEKRWSNTTSGHSGMVVPEKTFLTRDGKVCRSFRHSVAVGDGIAAYRDIACRSSSGRWKLLGSPS